MAALVNNLSFSFTNSFRVKYYDYVVKEVQWDTMYLVCIDGYFLNVSFNKEEDTFRML